MSNNIERAQAILAALAETVFAEGTVPERPTMAVYLAEQLCWPVDDAAQLLDGFVAGAEVFVGEYVDAGNTNAPRREELVALLAVLVGERLGYERAMNEMLRT